MDHWDLAKRREARDGNAAYWAAKTAKALTDEQLAKYACAPNSPALTEALQTELLKRLKRV